MKLILILSLCILFAVSVQAQLKPGENKEITNLTLGVEDKSGNIVEDIETIDVKDIPIYCYVNLSTVDPTMVRMEVIAIKAKKIRGNTKIVTVRYKTQQGENQVSFNAKPGKIWAEGNYRVDIYLDGDLARSKEFKVKAKD